MATPKETYAQQFRAYAQPAATPVVVPADIPASVRTYSVFDPNSNTWRRMTNGGRSPLPVQGQTPVVVQTPVRSTRKATPKVSTKVTPSKATPTVVVNTPANNSIPNIPEEAAAPAVAELSQGIGKTPEGDTVYTSVLDNPVLNMAPDYRIPRDSNRLTYADTQYLPDPEDEVVSGDDPDFVRQDNLSYYPQASPEFRRNYNIALGALTAPVLMPLAGGLAKTVTAVPLGLARTAGQKALSAGTGLLGAAWQKGRELASEGFSHMPSFGKAVIDTSKNLYSKLGGFLRKPATVNTSTSTVNPSTTTYTKVRPMHQMKGPRRRIGRYQYYN